MSSPADVIAEAIRDARGRSFDGVRYTDMIATAALAALEEAGYELVKLPMPGEYGPGGQRIWNDYPFVKQRGEDILLGASCEHVYTINCHEARLVAGDLLAAANHAEEAL